MRPNPFAVFMRQAAQGQATTGGMGSIISQMEAAKAKVKELRKELDLLDQHVTTVGGSLQHLEVSAPPSASLNAFGPPPPPFNPFWHPHSGHSGQPMAPDIGKEGGIGGQSSRPKKASYLQLATDDNV
jgi:hypothetical protein